MARVPRQLLGDEVVSGVRVARGTIIGVRVCVEDAAKMAADLKVSPALVYALDEALEFADRGAETLNEVHAALVSGLDRLGVPITLPRGRKPRRVLPAANRAGANRPPIGPQRRRRKRAKKKAAPAKRTGTARQNRPTTLRPKARR